MVERVINNKRTATFESASITVRAMLHQGKMVFSANDILKACGIGYPVRWISRQKTIRPDLFLEDKLLFPMMTRSGRREFWMTFITPEAAAEIIEMLSCAPEIQKWLMNDVLNKTFTQQSMNVKRESRQEKPQEKEDASPISDHGEAIGARIDGIIMELLELKMRLSA